VVQPPSGTVTFLFTDVEGSTRLWQECPEGMSVALARHDEILRVGRPAFSGQLNWCYFMLRAAGSGTR
jgi:hypothetical protein